MEIGKSKEAEARKALVRFDQILKSAERKGVKVVSLDVLRRQFDGCVDRFEVFAAELSTWNQEVI